MQVFRKFSAAIALAVVMAGGLTVSVATAEAGGNRKGGNPKEAICAYLYNIISYPYTSPTIRAYAISLYTYYGCNSR